MTNNPNIIFTKPNKDNTVVALDRSEYIVTPDPVYACRSSNVGFPGRRESRLFLTSLARAVGRALYINVVY